MRMYVDRRLLTHFEWLLPIFAIAVRGLGIAEPSATHAPGAEGPSPLAIRQGLWFTGGVVGMLPCSPTIGGSILRLPRLRRGRARAGQCRSSAASPAGRDADLVRAGPIQPSEFEARARSPRPLLRARRRSASG
jgi:hypothetical protein